MVHPGECSTNTWEKCAGSITDWNVLYMSVRFRVFVCLFVCYFYEEAIYICIYIEGGWVSLFFVLYFY
jgi:hypothetical protein